VLEYFRRVLISRKKSVSNEEQSAAASQAVNAID
jgi:hypothetical protein